MHVVVNWEQLAADLHITNVVDADRPEMCSERDSPLEPFVLPAPGQPELARLTCGAHLGPPVLTRKQKRPRMHGSIHSYVIVNPEAEASTHARVNSLVCDRAAVFCAAGPPEALSWMSRLVTQAAKRERELARAHSQRLKQATLSLPGESVSRGFADRGALEGYPSHYTSLDRRNKSHFDIPYRIYLLNDVLQQTQIYPYYGWRYGLNLICDRIYRLRQIIPKTFFSEIDAHSICPDIVSLAGVVVVTWALCVSW